MASASARSATSLERESTAGLLSRVFGDFGALLRNEVALAKAELSESSTRAKAGMIALIGAVSTLLAGGLALAAAIILALAKVVEPWLAALIVGLAITLVGALLLIGARKKLLPPHIEIDRTRTAVRNDVDVLARRT
ncbi:MAG TPA: phage holin family protein [Steroidobacteraceae bacterium]|jgi:putative superfamily III holin-X|nr:phage holin family protein [Steroidobacteraceae bacterium]